MRLDKIVVEKGLLKSRTLARSYIENGSVTVNGSVSTKCSLNVSDDDEIRITVPRPKYVSRGGFKLEAVLDCFNIEITGAKCCDIGSSTGGFTDCLLQRGAAKVYAVDSGTDQLDPSLRSDDRVVSIERFNARDLSTIQTDGLCDVVTVDVSFISQSYVIVPAYSVLKKGGYYLGLIKPQFECGREGIGKGGIVKNDSFRQQAVCRITDISERTGFSVLGVIESPIEGGDGNKEYLFCARKN